MASGKCLPEHAPTSVSYLFVMHMRMGHQFALLFAPSHSKLAEAFHLQGETDLDGATHAASLSPAGGDQVPGAQYLPRKPRMELALAHEFLSSAVTGST